MYLLSIRTLRMGSRCNFAPFVDFKRNLFSKEELGVTLFERNRQDTRNEFQTSDQIDTYKKNTIENFSNQLVDEMRNNLKKYLFLVDGKPNELKHLKNILLDYQQAYNKRLHNVKDFCFGTQIMRLFYLLNLPDDAIKFYKDVDLKNHFQQMQTYKVMLSLLYENKRYAEVLELYTEIRKRLERYEIFPDITINCLAFGACYNLNTPEHYQYAQDLWQRTKNIKQLSRSTYFLAAMALNHNAPNDALNLVTKNNLYVTVRFIRLMAFTQSGNLDMACEILCQTIESYKLKTANRKPSFGKQMIEALQEQINKSGTEKQLSKFNQINEDLKSLDLINNETLDQYLSAPFPPMLPRNQFLKMKNKAIRADN